MVVQHNLTAMNSNRMLGVTTSKQAKSTEKLSSGYKINRAADDAAGLSISEKMRKQIRGLTQASSNAQDGISAVQTAEGALNEVQDMLQRMNELAVKAANGTNSEDDRNYIQDEVNQLIKEIDRVSTTTKFNETYLLKGDDTVKFTATPTAGLATTLTDGSDTAQATIGITIAADSYKTEGGKSDVTFSLMGKNFSVRLEETDDNKTLATKLAKAMNENQITDSKVGAFKATVTDNVITLTAAEKGKVADTTVIKDGAKLTAEGTGVLTLDLHVGADSTSDNQISVDIKQMSATVLGLKTGNSTTGDATGNLDTLLVNGKDDKNARAAIDTIASALQEVSKQRSALGAAQNRLEHTIANLDNVVENTTSAESSIRDTDMATEMVKYSNNNILAQAGQAMLAQANQSNQGVLSLLQ
ncbi:flagellin N-terminal helical domain-containing protein [Eshraghiella crossota]|uniref:flagellin N-terminal helical domain-containing protein n=1 Tax=Eshraghiella crossota TaxID=45851 RepID=UPI003F817752